MTSTSPTKTFVDLTQHEIKALGSRHNLADAHTHQFQSPTQHDIVASLPELWYQAERTRQTELERQFIESFFELQGQPTALRHYPMLSYAASISTVTLGLYLARRGATVTLIEPCFDNLADVLRNCNVPLVPLAEDLLVDIDSLPDNLVRHVSTDALFLVDPNNPTGFSLLKHGRQGFAEVARFCRDTDTLLIFDFSFASFAVGDPGIERFDVYQLLDEIGTSYIAIEDTGKTWPVQDVKAAMLCCSDDVYHELYNVHTSILLNVSPFALNLLTHYVRDSIQDGFASVRQVLLANRDAARKALDGTVLSYQEPVVDVSVAWFAIREPAVRATQLQRQLLATQVYVLPGTYFYWYQHKPGEGYLRLALARDPDGFGQAMVRLQEGLERLGR